MCAEVVSASDFRGARAYKCLDSGCDNLQDNDGDLLSLVRLIPERKLGEILASYNPPAITIEERLRVARMHVRMLDAQDPHTVVHMRNYFMPYFKGVPSASALRGQVVKCTTLADFEDFFDYICQKALSHGYKCGASSSGGLSSDALDCDASSCDSSSCDASGCGASSSDGSNIGASYGAKQ